MQLMLAFCSFLPTLIGLIIANVKMNNKK
ncbi:putative holin-like toxin [Streptococcus pneumoniae]